MSNTRWVKTVAICSLLLFAIGNSNAIAQKGKSKQTIHERMFHSRAIEAVV